MINKRQWALSHECSIHQTHMALFKSNVGVGRSWQMMFALYELGPSRAIYSPNQEMCVRKTTTAGHFTMGFDLTQIKKNRNWTELSRPSNCRSSANHRRSPQIFWWMPQPWSWSWASACRRQLRWAEESIWWAQTIAWKTQVARFAFCLHLSSILKMWFSKGFLFDFCEELMVWFLCLEVAALSHQILHTCLQNDGLEALKSATEHAINVTYVTQRVFLNGADVWLWLET